MFCYIDEIIDASELTTAFIPSKNAWNKQYWRVIPSLSLSLSCTEQLDQARGRQQT